MSFNVNVLWLIPILPLAAFAIIVFLTRSSKRLSGHISIAAILLALLISLWSLAQALAAESGSIAEASIRWLTIGDTHLEIGVYFDAITAVMLVVVTLVSFLVQLFSTRYLTYSAPEDPYAQAVEPSAGQGHGTHEPHGDARSSAHSAQGDAHGHGGGQELDPGYGRYFAFISLFTVSMLVLVLANNLLVLYMGWELVGLCSYLLIGFWFHKKTDEPVDALNLKGIKELWLRTNPSAAAKKAFIVTRIGDFGFLIGILIVFFLTGTLNYTELFELAEKKELLVGGWLTVSAVLLFCGAIGKSAQFPLHVWLPDAMQGPTPVSALIHAATMVAAGVYMVARLFPIFEHSAEAMLAVAIIGGLTALFAASMGIVMNDIKQVMAYSTISQLGYMIMGLGAGGLVAGVFHLFNHAFFKALLFLGAGAVIYCTGHVQDMRLMGGLRKRMPVTYWALMMASLSLAGIFPFSGFWSKDEILNDVFMAGAESWPYTVLFLMGLAGAFITAFYTTRMMLLTFHGSYRGPRDEREAHGGRFGHQKTYSAISDPHWAMSVPLVVLAVLAVVSGLWNVNGAFTAFVEPQGHFEMNWGLAALSVAVAASGIVLSLVIYRGGAVIAAVLPGGLRPLHTLLYHKYYMDDLYGGIVKYILIGGSTIIHWFDQTVVDGIVNGVGHATVWLGGELSRVETGRLQNYALGAFGGAIVIVFLVFFSGAR